MGREKYKDEHGRTLYKVIIRARFKGYRKQKAVKGITTLAEAKRVEKRLKKEIENELYSRYELGETFYRIKEDYIQELYTGIPLFKKLEMSTVQDYESIFEKWTKRWDYRPASEITQKDVWSWMVELRESHGLSVARVNKIKNVVGSCFTWAINEGRIKGSVQSPTVGLKLDNPQEKAPQILTQNELKLLLEKGHELEHPHVRVWEFASLTGMRSGEMFALKWSDVDFEKRRIRVSRSFCGRTKRMKAPKNGCWRDVPINRDLEIVLKELRAQAGCEFVFPRMADWRRGEMARCLRTFCAGIGLPQIRLHDLRACFATHLIKQKVAPAVVMKICGWKELKTMQIYVRMAGIEIEGATDDLQLIPPRVAVDKVVDLVKRR